MRSRASFMNSSIAFSGKYTTSTLSTELREEALRDTDERVRLVGEDEIVRVLQPDTQVQVVDQHVRRDDRRSRICPDERRLQRLQRVELRDTQQRNGDMFTLNS